MGYVHRLTNEVRRDEVVEEHSAIMRFLTEVLLFCVYKSSILNATYKCFITTTICLSHLTGDNNHGPTTDLRDSFHIDVTLSIQADYISIELQH